MASVDAKKCDQCGTVEHSDQLTSWVGLAKPNGVMLIGPIDEVAATVESLYGDLSFETAVRERDRLTVKELCSQGCLHEMISSHLQKGEMQGHSYGRRRSTGIVVDDLNGIGTDSVGVA